MREHRNSELITVIVLGWRLRVIEHLGNSSAGVMQTGFAEFGLSLRPFGVSVPSSTVSMVHIIQRSWIASLRTRTLSSRATVRATRQTPTLSPAASAPRVPTLTLLCSSFTLAMSFNTAAGRALQAADFH